MAVKFTDKTVGKSLSIRRSSKDSESKGALKVDCTKALQIEIDEDLHGDVGGKISKAEKAEKARSKNNANSPVPVRRKIFGSHSPVGVDRTESQKKFDACDKEARPASRTHSRVLSNEDAMKAIDAVVTLSEIQTEAQPHPNISQKCERLPGDAMMSPALTTPSLPTATPTHMAVVRQMPLHCCRCNEPLLL